MTEGEFLSFSSWVQWLVLALVAVNFALIPRRGAQAIWMTGAGAFLFLALWLRTQPVPALASQACWIGVLICLVGHRRSAKRT
ncbi:MAG: hypothetical protein WHU10_08650 [Fimbriimonadales bacterium]